MKAATVMLAVALLAALTPAVQGGEADPVSKVLRLLADLHAKVVKEGESEQKTFAEFSEWCEDRSKNLQYDVKTAKSEVEDLKASIEQATSSAASLSAQIEELTGSIASNEQDLKAATKIRKAEESDFAAAEKELVEVIGSLERAVGILERESRKGGAAMVQVQKATSVVQAIQAMLEASMLGSRDATALTALVQGSQRDADADFGAPDPAAYESHSGSIIETLENLLDKAKDQLQSARTKETNSKHNFEMLRQSLEDEVRFGGKDLDTAKKGLAAQQEAKASAEGRLADTSKALAEDQQTAGTLKQDCMMRAQDHEAAMKSRSEELKALAEARKAIAEMGNAGALTYSGEQASFLQVGQVRRSGAWTGADLANFEAVRFLRNLARKTHSEALAQLARRMASAMRAGAASGEDPFAKVRGLIEGMIESLQRDAQADASHKAYCDKELGETLEKKASKEAEAEKLSTRIDSMTAESAQLKEHVAFLQKSLSELAKSQAELTKIRNQEKGEYNKDKPEMESGLEGVKMALKILREYYAQGDKAHEAASGGASGVIGLLEVVESDFSKTLAEMSATEATSQAEYDQEMKEAKIEKATKEQSVKYETKEARQLDEAISETTSDRAGVLAELGAINDYDKHLVEICTAKPESYSDRKARREAEIAGLKEALSILEGEAVLLQRKAAAGYRAGLRTSRRA